MSLNRRLDLAEAEARARLEAARNQALSDWVDWVCTGSPEEQAALWLYLYANNPGMFAADWTPEQIAEVTGGRLELTPEAEALALAFDARCPAALVERMRRLGWGQPVDETSAGNGAG